MVSAKTEFTQSHGAKKALVIRGWKETLFPDALTRRGYDVSVIDYKSAHPDTEIDPQTNLVITRIFSNREKGLIFLKRAEDFGLDASEATLAHEIANSKFETANILSAKNIPSPETERVQYDEGEQRLEALYNRLLERLGPDFVLKPDDGNRGRNILFPVNFDEFKKYISENSEKRHAILAQKFIPTGETASHIRAIVIDGQFVTAKKFNARRGSKISNLAQGGSAEDIGISHFQKSLAERAARALNVTFAGVDLVVDEESGDNYVLEVNMTPNISALSKSEQDNVIGRVIDYTERKDLFEFIKSIERAWSAHTTSDQDGWNENNPAWGQCAVTASLIAEKFGGDLVRVTYETPEGHKGSHYFNILEDGFVVDATRKQFPEGTSFNPSLESDPQVFKDVTAEYVKTKDFQGTALDYVVSFEATRQRLQTLLGNMEPSQSAPDLPASEL